MSLLITITFFIVLFCDVNKKRVKCNFDFREKKVIYTRCKLTIMSLELAIARYKLAIVTKSQHCKI